MLLHFVPLFWEQNPRPRITRGLKREGFSGLAARREARGNGVTREALLNAAKFAAARPECGFPGCYPSK
jgi:hypothetical protein